MCFFVLLRATRVRGFVATANGQQTINATMHPVLSADGTPKAVPLSSLFVAKHVVRTLFEAPPNLTNIIFPVYFLLFLFCKSRTFVDLLPRQAPWITECTPLYHVISADCAPKIVSVRALFAEYLMKTCLNTHEFGRLYDNSPVLVSSSPPSVLYFVCVGLRKYCQILFLVRQQTRLQ